ncbi:MAG: PadR family transcriptional regulator [Clostridia bacterium]|nr:PadR family transcriptional regulator [Clostridia bacterium]
MDYIPSEMLRGHLDTIILLSLADSDKHSNQIKEFVEKRSGGQYVLKQGTFYSCLQRIVKQGYVTEYRTTDEDGVRRKFFQLTEKGKAYIDTNVDSWSFSKHVIDLMISSEEDDSEPTFEKKTKTAKEPENVAVEEPVENEVIPVIDDTDLSSIDYTQAETFFSKNPQEKAKDEKNGFEQLSFEEEPYIEDEYSPKDAFSENDDRIENFEPIIEAKEPEAAVTEAISTVKKEEPAPSASTYEPKKTIENDDHLNSLDSSVDYRTILEGIFPSHKSTFRNDPREMTYE